MRILGALFALLLACSAANATISWINGFQTSSATHGTTTCSIDSSVSSGAGDDFVVAFAADTTSGAAPAVSGVANTGAATLSWSAIGPPAGVTYTSTVAGNARTTMALYRAHVTANGAYTVTATFTGTFDNCGAYLLEVNGQNASTPLDTNTGVSGPYNNGGVSTSGAPSISGVTTNCFTDAIAEFTVWWGTGGSPPSQTVGTGFSTASSITPDNGSFFGTMSAQVGIFTSAQSNATLSFGTSWTNGNLTLLVAYQDAAASCSGGASPLPAGSLMMMGIGE